jgi:regulator of sigma E protease
MAVEILSLLGVLVVLVMAHECGHFFTARATHVKIEEFALFFPPRLFSIKRGDTRYSINMLPLGGYVKMAGEEDPDVPGSLAGKSHIVRIMVLAAGSLMNAILPILLFSIAFMIPHNAVSGRVVVDNVSAGSPAALAGMVVGDTILSINGDKISNIGDLQREIQLKLGVPIEVQLKHTDSTVQTVRVTPRWRPPVGQGAIGIQSGLKDITNLRQSFPFWKAVPMGVSECIETYVLFKNSIITMIIGAVPVVLAGPVGVAQITGEAARAGISYLLEFAAFFSINLAIINIFPLPALDGGRVAFVVLEWLRRGKRVSPRLENIVHTIGFFLLIAAMLAITYQDIIRIMAGGSIIP